MIRTPFWSALALSLVFAACGDDGVESPDSSLPDGGPPVVDAGGDGGGDGGGGTAPAIASLDPSSVAIASSLMIDGSGFVDVESVTIGDVAQVYTVDGSMIVIDAVAEETPTGDQDVEVTTSAGAVAESVTVLTRLAVSGAASLDATTVSVTFNRALDAATVEADDFVIDGLDVTDATVDDDRVELTTAAQVAGTSYSITVGEVADAFGNALTGDDEAVFPGFEPTLPQITDVSPTTGVVGHTGLTITGVNLAGASVTVGGIDQDVDSTSATEIVTDPLGSAIPTGTQDVVVTTSGGTSGAFAIDVLGPFAIVMAEATSATEVVLTTNRAVDPTSVDPARFSIPALTVTGASSSGSTITLTTAEQTPAASYSAGADSGLVDMNGAPVTSSAASFMGFVPPLPEDFVVVRVGDGISGLDAATAAAVFLERRLLTDASVADTTALPTVAAGANVPFALPGTGFSNRFLGTLSRSPDRQSVAILGYQLAPGVALADGARVVAVIDAAGTVDTSTTIGTRFATTVPRGAATDGTNVWVVGGFGGVHHTTVGSTAEPTPIVAAPSSGRAIGIYEGELLYSSSDGTSGALLSQVGTGMPTTASTTTPIYTSDTPSPAGFAAFDLDAAEPGIDLVYQADKTSGLLRFRKSGGTWALEATFTPALLDVACFADGADVTCVASSDSDIYRLEDVGHTTAGGALTSIATAAANTEFRGIALTPGAP